jgi:hypothetical protein
MIGTVPPRNLAAVVMFFMYFYIIICAKTFASKNDFFVFLPSERFSRFCGNTSVLIFLLTLMQVLRMRGFDGDFLKRRAGDEEEEEGESSCVDWSNHRVMEWLRQVGTILALLYKLFLAVSNKIKIVPF